MNPTVAPDAIRNRFKQLLHGAIIRGDVATGDVGLGPRTRAAIARVADEHPEAPAMLVAQAYETFRDEHGASSRSAQ
jgi:hypothetical protein